ncbi:MAG: hypothetical protein ACRDSR_20705 [Pseudonocardiaceae bacterium]
MDHWTRISAGLEAVREFERDCGPTPPELKVVARRELEDAGVISRRSA